MSLEITTVTSERELETFLHVPAILRPESYINKIPGRWVRPVLDRRANPYFRHADHTLMIARREGRPAGRVAAFIDHLCNRTLGERLGSFGLFDCIDSPRVAAQLLEAAEEWLSEKGASVVRGPFGPAMRMGTGVLVEGHGQTPMPGATFDPPELGALIEGAGYLPARDLHAYRLEAGPLSAEVASAADEARGRKGLALESFRLTRYDDDIATIRDVLNDLPGLGRACAPWTLDEVRWMARKLWTILDPSLVVLIKQGGEPAAVGLALRNVREVLGGRSPRSTMRDSLQIALARRRHRLESARITLLAVRPKFDDDEAGPGSLRSLLLAELLSRLRALGVRWTEVSLVDPTDSPLVTLLEAVGAEVTKTYRIFEKSLASYETGPSIARER